MKYSHFSVTACSIVALMQAWGAPTPPPPTGLLQERRTPESRVPPVPKPSLKASALIIYETSHTLQLSGARRCRTRSTVGTAPVLSPTQISPTGVQNWSDDFFKNLSHLEKVKLSCSLLVPEQLGSFGCFSAQDLRGCSEARREFRLRMKVKIHF